MHLAWALTMDETAAAARKDEEAARIAAALSGDRWRLSLAVENPGDVRGNTFAYGNPFTLRTQPQAAPLRPRTVSVTVSRRFGS